MVVVASQVKVVAQRLNPVFKADQSGSATGIGAAHPVVCHRDMLTPVVGFRGDSDQRWVCVLGGVRQRFCDNVVGRHLN